MHESGLEQVEFKVFWGTSKVCLLERGHPEMCGIDESGGQGSVGHHLKSQALFLTG